MSKSKGEFLTVSLLEEKGYDPAGLPPVLPAEPLSQVARVHAGKTLTTPQGTYQQAHSKRIAALEGERRSRSTRTPWQRCKSKFTAALDNDLNTSLAVTALYDVLKYKTNDDTKLCRARRL